MRNFLIFLTALMIFLSYKSHAQLKPAQSQYLQEKGALINPSFEQGYKGWTITGCTKSLVSDTPYLSKSLKLTCINETFSIKQNTTSLISFKGQQGALNMQIKASALGVKVRSKTDTVEDFNISIDNSTTYKKLSNLGFVAGAASNEVEVYADSNFTGEIIIDDISYGISNILQTIQNKDKQYSEANGDFTVTGTNWTTIRAVAVPYYTAEGIWRLRFNIFGQLSTNAAIFVGTISGISAVTEQAITAYLDDGSTNTPAELARMEATGFRVHPDTLTLKNIRISGDVQLNSKPTWAEDTGSSTLITQNKELNATTKNSVSTSFSSLGLIQNEEFTNAITVTPDGTVGAYTINYAPLGLTETPVIQVVSNSNNNNDITVHHRSVTNTTAIIRTYINGVAADAGFDVTLHKQGLDVNKSGIIVGKFEGINSTELVKVHAINLVGATSSTSYAYNYINSVTEIEDNYNALNDTGDIIFAAPRDSYYSFDLGYRTDYGTGANVVECGLDGVDGSVVVRNTVPTTLHLGKCIFSSVFLTEGQNIRFYDRKEGSGTVAWNTDARFSYLRISELPTTESIIKNLNTNNNIECQKKILSTSTISNVTGVVSDLTFNNLEIGKKYSVMPSFRMVDGSSSVNSKYSIVNIQNGVQEIAQLTTRSVDIARHQAHQTGNYYFVASDTTLTVDMTSALNMVMLANGDFGSKMTLCELPDNTILNSTKFN